ncbi:MAG: DUF1727 domain-containing protein [Eubacterium sp.]|nr:DUF1727 domain-containing protein [Eubacterium sp.]
MMIAVLIAKLTALLLRLLHRGATTLPGKLALRLRPNILSRLSRGVRVICVTGTNGKTTTCALLAHAMQQCGSSYFVNRGGANMLTGVVTAFIMNCTVTGKCRKDYAILECDESSLPLITANLNAAVIAVTNLFRDQLDRYGEISHTLAKIKEGIAACPNAVLILNGDCPLTYSIADAFPNRVLTFGINDDIGMAAVVSDNRHCPRCGTLLRYQSRVFAQLGNFYCPHCGYCRRTPDCAAADISASALGSGFLLCMPEETALCTTALGGIYNVYNFLTAATVLRAVGIRHTDCLCSFTGAFGRMERFRCGKHTVLLLLVKNPVGLSSCIRYICTVKNAPSMCFALNDNEADGTDVSWIWDCDFTPIAMKNPQVCTAGIRAEDMALRLKYDNIHVTDIFSGNSYDDLTDHIAAADSDFVVFASYTVMMQLRRHFIRRFGGKEFWE